METPSLPLYNHSTEVSVLKASKRLGLIPTGSSSLTPVFSVEGETEHSATHFFAESDRIFAAKVASPGVMEDLWKQIEKSRSEGANAPLLPVMENRPDDGVIIYDDGTWIRKVLKRMKLISSRDRVVLRRAMTGFAGFSRIYLLHITAHAARQYRVVLVKFDSPARTQQEWKAIELIRLSGDVPKEIQLPFVANQPRDCLIVSPLFQGATATGIVYQAKEFLVANLLTNFGNVYDFLKLIEGFLDNLYKDAAHTFDGSRWKDFFGELHEKVGELQDRLTAEGACQLPDRSRFILPGLPHANLWANPLFDLNRHLDQEVGRLTTGTVHGDLQSTNVLVAVDQYEMAKELRVVDIDKFATERPIIYDFVRLEADFWRSVVTSRNLDLFNGRDEYGRQLATLEAIVLASDRLDGRNYRMWPLDAEIVKLANSAGRFIARTREYAWKTLGIRDGQKVSGIYFKALRFYHLRGVIHAYAAGDEFRARVMLLCASLAEETRRDLTVGHSTSRVFPAGWTDVPYATSHHRWYRAPGNGRGSSDERPKTKFGRGTAAFGQTGLLVSATEDFITLRDSEIHLNTDAIDVLSDRFQFANNRLLAETSGKLNASAFEELQWMGTATEFEENLTEKIERNSSHAQRNPFSILLIKAFPVGLFVPPEGYVGFSHVLPLTAEGFQQYCEGEIKDNEFPASLIAKPGERTLAFLLFSLAADCSERSNFYADLQSNRELASWKYEVVKSLLRGIAFQVARLMEVHGQLTEVTLLAQHDDVNRGMSGALDYFHFSRSASESGDELLIRSAVCRKQRKGS